MKIYIFLFLFNLNQAFGNEITFDLNQFLTTYLNKSLSIENKKLVSEEISLKVKESKAGLLPSLNIVNATSKTDKIENLNKVDNDLRNQTYLKLGQNIFSGFKNVQNIKYYDLQNEKAKFDIKDQKLSDLINGVEFYFSLLKNQKDLENIINEIESNTKSLKELQRNMSNGNARKSQVLSIQTSLANNQIDLQNNKNDFQLLVIKINNFLQTNYEQIHVVNTEFSKKFSIEQIEKKMNLESRPDYNSLKVNAQSLEHKVLLSKSNLLPVVDLSANYYFNDNSKTQSLKNNYSVALSLTLQNPFSIESNSQINQSEIEQNISLINLRQKNQNLSEEKKTILQNINSTIELIKNLEATKKISEENVNYLKKEYNAGLTSYSDLLNASTGYQQTIRKLDQAKLDLELKIAKSLIWSGEFEEEKIYEK